MKDVIELAKQADPGFEFRGSGAMADCLVGLNTIERFAALVRAAALEEAAGACEGIYNDPNGNDGYDAYYTRPYLECADAIRALKEKT